MTSSLPARVAAVLATLALAVVFATGGPPVWIPRGVDGVDRRTLVIALVGFFAIGFLVATAAALATHRAVVAKHDPDAPARSTLLRALPPTVTGLVLAALWAIAGGRFGDPPPPGTPVPLNLPTLIGQGLLFDDPRDSPVRGGPSAAGDGLSSSLSVPPMALVGVLALLAVLGAAAAWWWAGRRTPDEDDEAPDDEIATFDAPNREAARRIVVRSIDEMLSDPDPDTAVIGAYARLLEGLGESGAPRLDHEGPMEHLRRTLSTLEVRPAPLRELVHLFETARFSPISLTNGHRDRALAALRSVADDLGAGVLR